MRQLVVPTLIAAALGLLAGRSLVSTTSAQAQPANPPADAGAPAGAQPGVVASRGLTSDMIGKVIEGLRSTPGCLGADIARLQSGTFVIFGWFESKAAVMAWYTSDTHRAAMDAVMPGRDKDRVPMADVPEDVGPVMVVAAATPIPRDELKPGQAEGSVRLSIELYKPLPGGIRFGGGGFAPKGFKPSIRDVDAGGPETTIGR